jgi:3-deoxy-7-phosphoheptulonate synthase
MKFKLVSREYRDKTIIEIGGVKIGEKFIVIAGPCSVENRGQILETAEIVKKQGADILRGGTYKPRTSPYSFQGLGKKGLELLKEAGEKYKLPIVTEVLDPRHVDLVAEYADILQIGARNMQNYPLLKEVGKISKPVILKRGLASTIEEWLLAAEYIIVGGNENIILCERGIRTFADFTRFTLDLSAIPVVKELSHLPIIVDPSHASGKREYVKPLSLAAIAVGADGIMVEVHPNPENALSDGPQSLTPIQFGELMGEIKRWI